MPLIDGIALGFDFGARRIGVAIGNTLTRKARPLTTVDAVQTIARWDQISALIEQWHPQTLVVGIPRYPDGAPHAMTARCERFEKNRVVTFNYTLRDDQGVLAASRRRLLEAADDVDAAAATIILQQWLDSDA